MDKAAAMENVRDLSWATAHADNTVEPENPEFADNWLSSSAGVGAGGFEPPKAEPTGLQPVPFGRSGTPP
jgi:hypothetical protein